LVQHDPSPKSAFDTSTALSIERTIVALDRTLLAWIRTSISLITFGFSIQQFFLIATNEAREKRLIGPKEFGLTMVILGVLAVSIAAFQHRAAIQALKTRYSISDSDLLLPRSQASLFAALIAALGALGLFSMLFR
jgi:putative membrane protein